MLSAISRARKVHLWEILRLAVHHEVVGLLLSFLFEASLEGVLLALHEGWLLNVLYLNLVVL